MSTTVPERTQDEWVAEYVRRQAYWAHNGDPRCKHAQLTSGKHSNGFFNSRLVVNDPGFLKEVASGIVNAVASTTAVLHVIDRVVGPETGATKLAEAVALEIGERRGHPCKWASPKKREDGSLYFDENQEKVEPNEVVLLVEDVVTTGGSVLKAAKLCMDANATPLDMIGCIVNRSGEESAGGWKLTALVTKAMPMWQANECPLCAAGSVAVRPKDNWAELARTY